MTGLPLFQRIKNSDSCRVCILLRKPSNTCCILMVLALYAVQIVSFFESFKILDELQKPVLQENFIHSPNGDLKRSVHEHPSFPRTFYLNVFMTSDHGGRQDLSYSHDLSHQGKEFYAKIDRVLDVDEAEYSDVTQLYPLRDSSDLSIKETLERRTFPSQELENDCEPIAEWQKKSYPNCNIMHEVNIRKDVEDINMELIGMNGFWRNSWSLFDETSSSFQEKVVLKTLKYNLNFEQSYFENNRVDALSMNQLTTSPHIIDIYGFCGMSLITEFAGGRLVDILHSAGMREKLIIAKQIAQGVHDIHSIDGKENVSLVHNDINFANIVVGGRGVPLINDFNIAVLLTKKKATSKHCGFIGRFPNPQWKSPEEQKGRLSMIRCLSHKIDIYALGNIYYRILTGFNPWKTRSGSLTQEDKNFIKSSKRKGMKPSIPRAILESNDIADVVLVKIINACFEFEPLKRPEASKIVEYLSQAIISISDE